VIDELADYRARVVAALDQAEASASLAGGADDPVVTLGAHEWRRLRRAISPPRERCVCEWRVPKGPNEGKTLGQIAEAGRDGERWFRWAESQPDGFWDEAFALALAQFRATHRQEAA
jgi:hypothetical protein